MKEHVNTRPGVILTPRHGGLVMKRLIASAILVTGLGGCIGGHSSSSVSGRYVSDATITRIEPGETSQEWVLAVAGEPTRRTTLSSGNEMWVWEYHRSKSSRGSVFLLFNSSSKTQVDEAAYVEFRDGIVVDAWTD
ncbi:MAG: hypothetical protein KDA28_11660 [Phycisphaerales bacterium]|nr:hypothetical protein [Phycisphaerales bacterium]